MPTIKAVLLLLELCPVPLELLETTLISVV